jgi:hypothetical protein
MAGNQQDRARAFGQAVDHAGQIGLHRRPHRIRRPAFRVHEEAGAAAVRDEEGWKRHRADIGTASARGNAACGNAAFRFCRRDARLADQ